MRENVLIGKNIFFFILTLQIASCREVVKNLERDICKENVVAENSIIYSNIPSGVFCAAYCLSSVNCASVFYQPLTKKCAFVGAGTGTQILEKGENGWFYLNTEGVSSKLGCGPEGYKDTFTKHDNQFLPGHDLVISRNKLWKYTSSRNLGGKRAECRNYCLGNPACTSFELNLDDGVCTIQDVNKYKKNLTYHHVFEFHNRDYECSCPPAQGNNVFSCYSSTLDGSNVTYVCLNRYHSTKWGIPFGYTAKHGRY